LVSAEVCNQTAKSCQLLNCFLVQTHAKSTLANVSDELSVLHCSQCALESWLKYCQQGLALSSL